MDLRQIEFVEAVARHSSFTRAASGLHVAQPALSSAIQRLEAELGVRLFERSSRKVALTDAGNAFLAGGRRILAEMGRLSSEMGEFAGGARGMLRASWWYHTDPQMIDWVRAYAEANPGVEVSILEWSTTESLAGLRRGELDVASIALPRDVDLSGLGHLVLRREPYALVVPPNHRLAGASAVRIADLARERFVVTRPGTGLRTCFDHAFAGQDEPPHIAIETNELSAILALVAAGAGIAIIPPSIAEQAPGPVKLIPIANGPLFTLAVVWREGSHSPIVQRAIDLASQGGIGSDRAVAAHGAIGGEPARGSMRSDRVAWPGPRCDEAQPGDSWARGRAEVSGQRVE